LSAVALAKAGAFAESDLSADLSAEALAKAEASAKAGLPRRSLSEGG